MSFPGSSLTAHAAPTETLAGSVERVTYHNDQTGFCVLRIKARGQRDLVTVVGHAAGIGAGEWVQMSGSWVNDRTHGQQFKAAFLKASPPTTIEGIERYLGSGMIRGIGPIYAKRLVRAFGAAVFDLIEQEPGRLHEVAGIGPRRAERIVAGWAEQKVIREIMLFLHANGVGTSRAVRIFKTYGQDAVQVISENPYRLARDIRGIGFLTADKVAEKLGIEKTAMIRVRAGVSYALAEATDEGHCGLPVDTLVDLTARLIGVPAALIDTALALELEEGAVVAGTVEERRCVFLASLYRAEQVIAERLRTLTSAPLPWPPIDTDQATPWVERRTGLVLADSQKQALGLALACKALVITGGPGVGKTTLVNSVLRVLQAKGVVVALCAPTGRAAKRLSESTGLQARTIHRLLETDPRTGRFKRDQEHPLACDLLVVDEASMVDVPLMRSLLQALPGSAALLIVGDVDQLPSVGPGQVLADIIGSGVIPVVRLTEVFRQAAQSRVITNAHRINHGQMPDLTVEEGSDFFFVDATEPEEGVRKLLAVVRERIPARFGLDPVRDVQVLCPMNRGGLGARALNLALQQALNPPGEIRVERFGWIFCPGDKVMQVVNDYDRDVFNGDLGMITAVDTEQGELRVSFDGREVGYGFGELDELVLGLRHDDPQGAGLGIPGRGDPAQHPALRHAGPQPALHRTDPWQAAGGAGRPAESARHRGQEPGWTQAVVETAGMARERGCDPIRRAAVQTEVSDGSHIPPASAEHRSVGAAGQRVVWRLLVDIDSRQMPAELGSARAPVVAAGDRHSGAGAVQARL